MITFVDGIILKLLPRTSYDLFCEDGTCEHIEILNCDQIALHGKKQVILGVLIQTSKRFKSREFSLAGGRGLKESKCHLMGRATRLGTAKGNLWLTSHEKMGPAVLQTQGN